MSKDSAP